MFKNMKVLFVILAIIATAIQSTQSATLRRKPKVYNALITTDQNLTPSRAFPVIQPHLQETYAYPSYSYRLGLYNNGFQYGSAAASYNGFHHGYPRINPGLVQGRNFFSRDEIHSTLPPTSNDFGLPSLAPINSFSFGNLAPYPYHSYPIVGSVYDQFGGYLPPYSFYPPGFDGINLDKATKDANDKNDGNSPNGVGGGDTSSSNNNASPGFGGNNNGAPGFAGNSNGSPGFGGNNNGSPGFGGNNNGSPGFDGSSNGSPGFGGNNNGSPGSGGGSSSGSSGGSSNGSSGGGSSSGSSGGSSSGSSGGSSSGSSGGSNNGSSGFSGSSNGSSGFSGGSSSNTKSSRSRNFDKVEYPHQQSLNENIKNFPNKDPTIPDIDPSPPVRVKPLNK